MPDQPHDQPADGRDASSDDTQRLSPDPTTPVPQPPYGGTHPWSDPAPPAQPYQQPYGQQPQQQPYAQQPHQQPYPQQQPYAQQPYQQQPYQQYGAPATYAQTYATGSSGYGTGAPASSSKAVAVLVLGISSLVLLFMCGLGIITAVIALAMAPGAKREIRDSQGRLGGLGLVQGGVITSWVTIGLFVVGVVVVIAVMVAGVSTGPQDFNGV